MIAWIVHLFNTVWTTARAALLDRLDANVSSRASATDYTAGRASNLDNLNAQITSRASASDYTSTRAGNLDNLNAQITSRASALDYTPDRAASLDIIQNGGMPGTVKSIQRGGNQTVGSLVSTIYVSEVNINKSVLIYTGNAVGFTMYYATVPQVPLHMPMNANVEARLESSTTIRYTTNFPTYDAVNDLFMTIQWQLIEYY